MTGPSFMFLSRASLGLVLTLAACGERAGDSPRATPASPAEAESSVEDATDLGALERRLEEAGTTDDPVRREMIIEEVAQSLVRFHADGEADDPAPDGEPVRAPDVPFERDYDPEQLRREFTSALEGVDPAVRRLALREAAEFLARKGDLPMARELMEAILATKDGENGADAHAFATTFAEFSAEHHPAVGVEWARSLPPGLAGAARQELSLAWAKSDPEAVDAWRRSEEDAAARSIIIRSTGNAMRTADDGIAAAWAARLATDPRDGMRHSDVVVEHWARGDLNAVIDWISTIEHDDFQSRAMMTLASVMADRDPSQAGEWLAELPEGEWKTTALIDTATRWGTIDPAAAAQWLSRLDRPEVANAAAPAVAAGWAVTDRPGATAWIRQLPLDARTRAYALKLLGEE